MVKEGELKIEKSKFLYIGRWQQPTLSAIFWNYWNVGKIHSYLGIPRLEGRTLQLNGHQWAIKKDIEIINNITKKAIWKKDNDFFKKFVELSVKGGEEQLKIIKKLKNHTHYDLLELTKEFFENFKKIIVPWTTAIYIGITFDEIIEKRVKEKNISINEVLAEIRPSRPTYLIQQKREALAIVKEIKRIKLVSGKSPKKIIKMIKDQNPSLLSKIKKHVKKYEWYGTHHFVGKHFDEIKFIKEIREESSTEGLTPSKKTIKDKELKWLIKWASELAYIRLLMAETSDILAYSARPILKEIDSKLRLKKGSHVWLTTQEILNFLEKGIKPKVAEINIRKKRVGVYLIKGKELVFTGKELENIINKLLPKVGPVKKLKGTIACKGKGPVEGKIKVVITIEDVGKIKKGEILVAPETTPDFVPAIKKSSAIVTDQGGITSHAAIVSRELGIPCLVGTQIGTRVLKDGDLVRVDTNKGIVKIINKD